MFHNIPEPIRQRMAYLESLDTKDRTDGTPRLMRLRQIPAETGRFLALWVAGAPAGAVVEIGTSAGYSALWLALACRAAGRKLTTYELLEEKGRLAQKTFRRAEVEDWVELVIGDALAHLDRYGTIAFCFWMPKRKSMAVL
jgi:predicted O-methyltransferase YrrM